MPTQLEQILQNQATILAWIEAVNQAKKAIHQFDTLSEGDLGTNDIIPISVDNVTYNIPLSYILNLVPNVTGTTPAYEQINFGAGVISETAGDETTMSEIVSYINTQGFTITSGKLAVLTITVLKNQNWVRQYYSFTGNNTPDTYGSAFSGGPISESQLIWRSELVVQSVDENATIINIGNINNDTIEDWLNAMNPDLVDWENLADDGTTYYFSCLRNGDEQIYEYVGTLPVTLGSGNDTVTNTDFNLISSSSGAPATVHDFFTFNIENISTAAPTSVTNANSVVVQYESSGDSVVSILFDRLFSLYLSGLKDANESYGSTVSFSMTFFNTTIGRACSFKDVTLSWVGPYMKMVAANDDVELGNFNPGDFVKVLISAYSGGGTDIPPVDETYVDITALLADQNSQLDDYYYLVTDASDDPTLTSGKAIYLYQGTTVGDLTDYIRVWAESEPNNGIFYGVASQSGNYTVTSTDNRKIFKSTGGSITVPSNDTESLDIGFSFIIKKTADAMVELLTDANVTLEIKNTELPYIDEVYDAIEVVKEADNQWGVYGALMSGASLIGYPQALAISSVSIDQVTFLQVYKASDWSDLFTFDKDYFCIYSTDHETDANAKIMWGEMDDPYFTNFAEVGEILTPNDGYQAESPFLFRVDTADSGLTEEAFITFHTSSNDPDNAASTQESHLMISSGGNYLHLSTWVEKNQTDGDNVFGLEAGDNHTGYSRQVALSGGGYLAYHTRYAALSPVNSLSIFSDSSNGFDWARVASSEVAATELFQDASGVTFHRLDITPFYYDGVLYELVRVGNGATGDGYGIAICTPDVSTYKPSVYIETLVDMNDANTYYQFTMYLEGDWLYIYVRDTLSGSGSLTGDWYMKKIYLPNVI